MKKWWAEQIQEISNSTALRFYGAVLAFTHVLSSYFWFDKYLEVFVKVGPTGSAHCWPMAISCNSWRWSSTEMATGALGLYAAIGLLVTGLFLFHRVRAAFSGLVGLIFIKLILTSMSYDLQGNYQYMLYIVHVAFCFLPHKKALIPFLVGVFYWGAGLLKFNSDWLSGVSLLTPSFLPPWLQHLSLIYVVILEMIFVFGLFSSKKWIRWATLAQFFVFHAFSWPIVGYFYPLVMFSILSLFILIPACGEQWDSYLTSQSSGRKTIWIPILVLIALQVLPLLGPHDLAASGAQRFTSLSMLDARMECNTLLVRHKDRNVQIYDPLDKTVFYRTKCDPVVFISQLNTMCEKAPAENIDFILQSRRSTEAVFQTVLKIKNVCSKGALSLAVAEFL